MNQFLKKLFGFSIGPIIGAFISFITVPVTTYFVNPTEFGKASMFMVIQSLSVTLIYLGIDQSYAKEYHDSKDKDALFQNALFIPLMVTVILAIIISLFSSSFSNLLFNSTKYHMISVLFGVMLIFSVLERFILLTSRMEEKAFEYSFYSVLIKGLILLLTIAFILVGQRKFTMVVYATIFGQILGDIILIFKYRRFLKFSPKILDWALLRRMLYFGVPLIVAASVNNLLNTSGRFFLRGYSTYSELGIYNAALKISAIVTILQTAFTSFWVPTAYRWNKENKDIKHFNAVSEILLLGMTMLFFSILFLKKYIVTLLSNDYTSAQYVVGMLAMIPILYTLSETTTLGIAFSGKSYYNVFVSFLSLFPNIVLCYVLIPKIGTKGAAIAAAVSYVFFCFSRTWFSRKCGFKVSFKKQAINIIIFLLAAFVNLSNNQSVFFITVGLFILSVMTQSTTISRIIDIAKNPSEWNFN